MDRELKEYLRKNHSIVHTGRNLFQDLSIMDSDLKENRIFLIGENHGVKANVELKMKFLKYFKEKTNFKYYLCELPYSMTFFLNKYLETGDEKILQDIYEPLRGTDAWNKDEYNHWKDLYEFNNILWEDNRIILIGIDIEHQPKNALKFLECVLGKNNCSKAIINSINRLKDKEENITNEDVRDLYNIIKEELCKGDLKKDRFKIKHVNNNLLNMLEVYTGNNFNGIRDKKMYENFISISNYLPKGEYFGQIGLSHVFQKSFPYVTWFASSLNKKESPFRGKVLSVAYAYENCKYLYPTNRRDYVSSINTLDLSIEEFRDLIYSENTLFKLNDKDSPFTKELIWPLKHKFPKEGVTTDYFQYLVVVKDSEEMEGLNV